MFLLLWNRIYRTCDAFVGSPPVDTGSTTPQLLSVNQAYASANDASEDTRTRHEASTGTLRHLASTATSPVKPSAAPTWDIDLSDRLQAAFVPLPRFRDEDEIDADLDVPTIKAPAPALPRGQPSPSSNHRLRMPTMLMTLTMISNSPRTINLCS